MSAEHLEDAFLSFSVTLYNKSIRKVKTNPKKIYAIDSAIVRATTFDYENDLGRIFKNIIYLDLRRRGCKINYYLTSERYEIDFLIQTAQGQKKLFQVTWNHADQNTLARENRALLAGMKELNIAGELITLESYLRDGIRF